MADGGIILPKKISWGVLAAFVGLAVQAGIAEYRLSEQEDLLDEVRAELRETQKEYDKDSDQWVSTLNRIDKYVCRICESQLGPDRCGICDD